MNAKIELLQILTSRGKNEEMIRTIAIKYEPFLAEEYNKKISVVEELDFDYDDGYGTQELFGYVVFTDDSWLERHEYDGAEWWEYKETPTELFLSEYMNGDED